MHRTAEEGIAAHWRYKEGKWKEDELDKHLSWLRQILEWQQDTKDDPSEFMENLRVELFRDEVFVFTPKGDLIKLPLDSTPVDAEVSLLVDGVTKISELRFESRAERQAENFRKMIVSMVKDIRVILIKFADRPEVRVGADEIWDQAEVALKTALEKSGLEYTYNPGEGAFYGPKLEFVLRDAIGRDWQCGTHQVDLNLPGRLGATYIGEDGQKHTPVLLHRAIFGSLERFIGILLEHHAGNLPLWLAPLQAKVLTITSDADDYANEVVDKLQSAGIRADADLRNEKISYKVREHSLLKTPVIIALGKREVEERTVSVRRLGQKGQNVMALTEAVTLLSEESRSGHRRNPARCR